MKSDRCQHITGKTVDDCPTCDYLKENPVLPGSGMCKYPQIQKVKGMIIGRTGHALRRNCYTCKVRKENCGEAKRIGSMDWTRHVCASWFPRDDMMLVTP
jgi:hypothetical protein